ncbi:hypothetical protein BofuT4_P153810.1 [Botrytis cinerea T4]|uniref:Uncharacterized protein n=1 Tax=Botryotinia fuckeliana (strain T4) TaxID=999810 RepID=G2YW21_BOTF4|nr:hypothetical protein BofuT4_P153810.1 [Botrytis cinerea T4]
MRLPARSRQSAARPKSHDTKTMHSSMLDIKQDNHCLYLNVTCKHCQALDSSREIETVS